MCGWTCSLATRIGINNHFCKDNNITDLSNKYFAQNNLALISGNLIGFLLSLSIPLPYNFFTVFSVIGTLTVFHIYASFKHVKHVVFNELNNQRAYYVAIEYLFTKEIFTPEEVSRKESIFFNQTNYLNFCNTNLDVLFNKEKNNYILYEITDIFKNEKFLTYVKIKKKKFNVFHKKNDIKIYTFLRLDANHIDIFIAYLYSIDLYLHLRASLDSNKDEKNLLNIMKENLENIKNINTQSLLDAFKKKGWETNFGMLEEKYMRYQLIAK